jgi:hypothetical protein
MIRPLDALLIVDMQTASFADGSKYDVSRVVHRVNRLARFVRGHHNRTWAGLIATPPVRVGSTEELLVSASAV